MELVESARRCRGRDKPPMELAEEAEKDRGRPDKDDPAEFCRCKGCCDDEIRGDFLLDGGMKGGNCLGAVPLLAIPSENVRRCVGGKLLLLWPPPWLLLP